jgi:hypothetical protein
MTSQQQGLLDALTEAGWELVASEQLHEWWADDVWRVRSVWSPQSREFYITFLVDPQLDLHRSRKSGEGVWAVGVTPALPVSRQIEPVFSLRHGWQERLSEIVAYIARFRHECVA